MLSFTTVARVVQWIERFPPEEEVVGSTPTASTKISFNSMKSIELKTASQTATLFDSQISVISKNLFFRFWVFIRIFE